MPLFYPVKTKEGKDAILNAEMVFCYIDNGLTCIAISIGGGHVEIASSLDEVKKDIEEMDTPDETED